NQLVPEKTISFTTVDVTRPVLTQVTAVSTPTKNRTPSYSFRSSEAGTISYGGSCGASTSTITANTDTTIVLSKSTSLSNPLDEGTYIDCAITVRDSSGNRGFLNINPFTIDITPPTVQAVSPANNLTDISLGVSLGVRFSEPMDTSTVTANTSDTTCAGYGVQVSKSPSFGDCVQMSGAPAYSNFESDFLLTPSGNLPDEEWFKIRVSTSVTDLAGNSLATEYTMPNGFETADINAPVLTEVTAVTTPSNDDSPDYVFKSNEDGTLSFPSGISCSSNTGTS
ncbi:uncharacterized protein METZ01_LOCUS404596, partial [marine metagenome]